MLLFTTKILVIGHVLFSDIHTLDELQNFSVLAQISLVNFSRTSTLFTHNLKLFQILKLASGSAGIFTQPTFSYKCEH